MESSYWNCYVWVGQMMGEHGNFSDPGSDQHHAIPGSAWFARCRGFQWPPTRACM